MAREYDRSAEDLGNVVALEHANTTVPDPQTFATRKRRIGGWSKRSFGDRRPPLGGAKR